MAKLNMRSVEANENDCGYHCVGNDSMFWRVRCTEGIGGKCEVDDSAPTTTGLKPNDYKHWCHNPDMPCMSRSVKVLEDEFEYLDMKRSGKDDDGNSIPDVHVGAGCYSQTKTAKVCNVDEDQNVPSVSKWEFDHKVDWRVDYELDLKLPSDLRTCKDDQWNPKNRDQPGGRSVPGRNGPNKFCENFSGPGGESLKFGMLTGNVVYENKSEPPYPKNLAFTETFDISWSKQGQQGPLSQIKNNRDILRSTHGFFSDEKFFTLVLREGNADDAEVLRRMTENEGWKIKFDYRDFGLDSVSLTPSSRNNGGPVPTFSQSFLMDMPTSSATSLRLPNTITPKISREPFWDEVDSNSDLSQLLSSRPQATSATRPPLPSPVKKMLPSDAIWEEFSNLWRPSPKFTSASRFAKSSEVVNPHQARNSTTTAFNSYPNWSMTLLTGMKRFCVSPRTADTSLNARVWVTETRSAKISRINQNPMIANTRGPIPQELSIATNLMNWSVMHLSATAKQ